MLQAPPVVAGYTVTCRRPDSFEELRDLVAAVDTALDGSSAVTVSFIEMLLAAPGVDPDGGVVRYLDTETGGLVACGVYMNAEPHVESTTLGWVHPEHTGRGLGSAIVTWGLDRSRALLHLAPEGARVTNRCEATANDTAAAALFADHGYRVDRHVHEMHLLLDAPVAVTDLPAGVRVRTMAGDGDLEILAGVMSTAFADHYGWVESSPAERIERWRNYRAMDEWDDDLVWLAEADGAVVGALVGLASHGSHTDAGYVGSLGVVREWRGRGLARALLTRAFAEYHRRGKRRVALDVDADSLTGATRLYESVGMHRVRTEVAYLVEIRPGTDLVRR